MLRLLPLLSLPLFAYNLLVLGAGVVLHYDMQGLLSPAHALAVTMFSGDTWAFSFGDFLILLTLVALFVEVIKATRTTSREIVNHGLSALIFVVALVEFLVAKGFASTPFFFIVVMSFFDVIAGYTISIVAAEHDLGLGRAGTD